MTGVAWLALAASVSAAPQDRAAPPGCVECHGAEGQELQESVHARSGISCVQCHGGAADAPDAGRAHARLRALAGPLEVVELCGGCHSDLERMRLVGLRTDQLSLYWTSRHGQRLRAEGDSGVAVCSSCHDAHRILPASDPRSPVHKLNQAETCGRCHADAELMERYGLRAEAPDQYRRSVHGRSLLEQGRLPSPACSDCHGSHGAAPPRATDVEMVCGHCHTVVAEYFRESRHYRAALAGAMGECTSCHGDHSVEPPGTAMFSGAESGHCGSCHEGEGEAGLRMAADFQRVLDGLDRGIAAVEEELRVAAARGLFLDEERGYLDDARGLRVRARPVTHALSPELLEDLESRGQAMLQETRESLEVKRRQLRDRRIFSAIYAGVVLLLVAVLQIYKREI